jgi:hypothetical protein
LMRALIQLLPSSMELNMSSIQHIHNWIIAILNWFNANQAFQNNWRYLQMNQRDHQIIYTKL